MFSIPIRFEPMTTFHVPLWVLWVQKPHVKPFWQCEDDDPQLHVTKTLVERQKYVHPYIIHVEDRPIGYVQAVDLYAYRTFCPEPVGLFAKEVAGNFCMDLFIGEKGYLNRGYGIETVKAFTKKLFEEYQARIIYVDPALSNTAAIRCYERAGFKFLRIANNGEGDCHVMRLKMPTISYTGGAE